MSGEIKYTSTISQEIEAMKSKGYGLTSRSVKIDSLNETNLPVAKMFVTEENGIQKVLNKLSAALTIDSNDALACFVNFEGLDEDLSGLIRQSWEGRVG